MAGSTAVVSRRLDTTAYHMRLLGPFVLHMGESLDVVSLPKGRATTLLALLAVHRNHIVERDMIAEVLWPHDPPRSVPQIIASLVSRLRRAVGPHLQRVESGYRLDTADWLVDLDESHCLALAAQQQEAFRQPALALAAAERALHLLSRGRPLEGLRSERLTDTLDREAHLLRRRVRQTLWHAAHAIGAWEQAADTAAAAWAEDPYDEPAARALMLAQRQLGRTGQALATFARLRRTLAEELGADPDPQTVALHLAVLRGQHVLDGAPEPNAGRGLTPPNPVLCKST